jgi:hypothetical protein
MSSAFARIFLDAAITLPFYGAIFCGGQVHLHANMTIFLSTNIQGGGTLSVTKIS